MSPPRNGPPLHAHGFEEFFYITRGTFLFELDGEQTQVGPGDMMHARADVPHTFMNVSEEEGRMLIVARPGGIERYFAELAARMVHDASNTAAFAELAVEYGIRILGPPLAARKP
ncbi:MULTISPECIES: cupin domain-containing protein [Acidobacterium]|nr:MULTISPECIES: cupin domain-containing protein [Acidobacterium]HCT61567.1 cupin domain-containing protein [Acidobacterium sp.]